MKKNNTTGKTGKILQLQRKLKKREERIRELENTLEFIKRTVNKRPERCSKCGCEKVYKNGHYSVSLKRFARYLQSNGDERVKLQQFICPGCGTTMHQTAKAVFFRLFRLSSLFAGLSNGKIIDNDEVRKLKM